MVRSWGRWNLPRQMVTSCVWLFQYRGLPLFPSDKVIGSSSCWNRQAATDIQKTVKTAAKSPKFHVVRGWFPHSIKNVLLVSFGKNKVGPVYGIIRYTIDHHLPVVIGVVSNPSINQPINWSLLLIMNICNNWSLISINQAMGKGQLLSGYLT